MYEFIIDGIAVTREEYDYIVYNFFTDDEITELFETGSVTVDQVVFEIRAVGIWQWKT